MKEIFGFQKLKISFSEILFQKKPLHASLILLFQLRNREEVTCKIGKRVVVMNFIKCLSVEVLVQVL